MLQDPLAAKMFDREDLRAAVAQVKKRKKYKPTVLVVSEDNFHMHFNALAVQPATTIGEKNFLREIGINRLMWAKDVDNGEFVLTSEKSYQALLKKEPNIETITLKEK